eukprot:13712446-Ditylum_brightwellii.AAC.1
MPSSALNKKTLLTLSSMSSSHCSSIPSGMPSLTLSSHFSSMLTSMSSLLLSSQHNPMKSLMPSSAHLSQAQCHL